MSFAPGPPLMALQFRNADTVDLPASVHKRAMELAQARGQSLSAVIADLSMQGLGHLGEPVALRTDPRSGFPVLSVGRAVTGEGVSAALAE